MPRFNSEYQTQMEPKNGNNTGADTLNLTIVREPKIALDAFNWLPRINFHGLEYHVCIYNSGNRKQRQQQY